MMHTPSDFKRKALLLGLAPLAVVWAFATPLAAQDASSPQASGDANVSTQSGEAPIAGQEVPDTKVPTTAQQGEPVSEVPAPDEQTTDAPSDEAPLSEPQFSEPQLSEPQLSEPKSETVAGKETNEDSSGEMTADPLDSAETQDGELADGELADGELADEQLADDQLLNDADAPLLVQSDTPQTPQLSDAQRASFEACVQQAAPQQYGGPAFNDLQPDLALAACNQAWQQVPSRIATISAYTGRVLEAQGQLEAAYWLYKRATADDLPVGYGLLAYRLMRLGDDDAKAAEVAETGHALGDWNASNVLATLYAQERIDGKGPADALALIEYVGEQGSPFAQYLTAWLYETHAKNTRAALVWYERAVENGEDAAAAFLADLLERGLAQQAPSPGSDTGGAKDIDDQEASQSLAQSTDDQPSTNLPSTSLPSTNLPSPGDLARAAALYWQALERGDPWAEQQFTQRGKERPAPVLMEIQRRLAAAGFAVGKPDGIFGRKTERAIRALVAKAAKR